jgi:hypothetical protein
MWTSVEKKPLLYAEVPEDNSVTLKMSRVTGLTQSGRHIDCTLVVIDLRNAQVAVPDHARQVEYAKFLGQCVEAQVARV